jgi:hypothetical protein
MEDLLKSRKTCPNGLLTAGFSSSLCRREYDKFGDANEMLLVQCQKSSTQESMISTK